MPFCVKQCYWNDYDYYLGWRWTPRGFLSSSTTRTKRLRSRIQSITTGWRIRWATTTTTKAWERYLIKATVHQSVVRHWIFVGYVFSTLFFSLSLRLLLLFAVTIPSLHPFNTSPGEIETRSHTLSKKMIYVLFFPAVAFLLAFIIGVIIVQLKWGPRICGLRHTALPDEREWEEDKAYDHGISYAWFPWTYQYIFSSQFGMLMPSYFSISFQSPTLSKFHHHHHHYYYYNTLYYRTNVLNEKPLILFCIL